MELHGYYPEEKLVDWIQEGDITCMQYEFHHSVERRREFVEFCKEKHLDLTEEAAKAFVEHRLTMEENGDI